jgi:hypothetical protein
MMLTSKDALSADVFIAELQPISPWKPLAQEYQLDYGGRSLGFVGAHEINCEAKSGGRGAYDQATERLGDPK